GPASSTSTTGPRSTSRTRSSWSASASCSSRSWRPTARAPPLAPHRFRVPDADAGRRLYAFLADLPEVGTRALAERLVTRGDVLVDGRPRPKSHRLAGGEEVDVALPAARVLFPVALARACGYQG